MVLNGLPSCRYLDSRTNQLVNLRILQLHENALTVITSAVQSALCTNPLRKKSVERLLVNQY